MLDFMFHKRYLAFSISPVTLPNHSFDHRHCSTGLMHLSPKSMWHRCVYGEEYYIVPLPKCSNFVLDEVSMFVAILVSIAGALL